MNHIEEMMRTAGVEQEEYKYCYWECKKPELENIACNNTQCPYYRHEIYPYPNFTASKQLEIIKLIIELPYKFVDYALGLGKVDNDYCIERELPTPYESRNCYVCLGRNQDFTQALAELTTELMNTGKLDKNKVKEILQ